ncbi:hypothetical protein Gogos_022082 [Gossypium gossypioides]|uniref:Leucine-rich repeat-containing N-terminal plant-type domain-containing protein n=1 Tax=Gossypium gossypioides TaxID=34282 RepID=A0A7J9CYC5_GOSGO|nr:hypothetical protein [Gossypium gossypioides]
MFSASLSFFCTTIMNIDLDYLDLSNNLLSSRIPDCWNKYIFMRLRNTSLYGKIPYSLKNCTQLGLLDLGDKN